MDPHHNGVLEVDVFSPHVVYKKIYWNVLPLYCCIAALCYIDRTNLAYASFGLARDLGFTPAVYGLGSGLFFLGYSVAMIPSQIMMLRVGVVPWLSIVVTCWGAVAAAFSMLFCPLHFYILRLCLGAAESGAFPAMWYYLSLMLPPEAMTVPLSVMEASVALANVASPLLAAALMLLDGTAGMKGWQWLFVSEGAPTIAVGLLIVLLLPPSLHKAEFLSVGERRFLAQKLDSRASAVHMSSLSDSSHSPARFELQMLVDTLNNPRIMWVSLMGLLKNIATNGMIFWTPIIVAAILNGDSLSPTAPTAKALLTSRVAILASTTTLGAASNRSLPHFPSHSNTSLPFSAPPPPLPSASSAFPAVLASAMANTHPHAHHARHTPSQATSTYATLLCSVPFLASAVFTLWLGHRSQLHGERALHLAVPYFVSGILFAAFPQVAPPPAMRPTDSGAKGAYSDRKGSNSVINSYIPSIASKQSLPLAYAVYNAIANLGSLIGPWLVGEMVVTSGGYANAIKLFGVVMCVASAMAWSTQTWGVTSRGDCKHGSEREDDSISRLLEESSVLDL